MHRTKLQFERLIRLDRLIRDGKYPNCLNFAAEQEVAQKTVQRDIDFLRDRLGAPIGYDREKKGFYYETPTWMLPSVLMSEGEVLAVLLAARALDQYRGSPVAAQLRSLFSKLSEMLPDKLSIRPELLYDGFTFRAPPARPVNAAAWSVVVRGLLDRRTVKLRYRPFGTRKTDAGRASRINPLHIANLQGEWYLFGVHAGHDDVRQFAMARIEQAAPTADLFDPPVGFDPAALLAGAFGRFAGGEKVYTVRLLFDGEVAEWVAEREWHPEQTLTRRANGDVELAFPAKGLLEVQRWVLGWGRTVRVLDPAALKDAVDDEVRAMAAARKGK